MRIIDSVAPLPKQMMLGAVKDATIIYRYGQIVAEQCKRMGIQMNYAPVMDVNNNPENPVINDRSFGEDKSVRFWNPVHERDAGIGRDGLCQTFSGAWRCSC